MIGLGMELVEQLSKSVFPIFCLTGDSASATGVSAMKQIDFTSFRHEFVDFQPSVKVLSTDLVCVCTHV